MKPRIAISFLLPMCLAAHLHAQLNTPKVGIVRYSDNSLHLVSGLRDDFIVSEQALGSANLASFSDSGGLIAKTGRIELIGPDSSVIAEYDSAESAPVLNMDGSLTSAVAWLPTSHTLVHWNGSLFVKTAVLTNLPGPVTAVRIDSPTTAKLLVTENGGEVSEATISLEYGSLIALDLVPAATGAAFAQSSFVLFHDEHGLEIATRSGALRTLSLTAPDLTIERMSSDWLHLASATAKQDWILHLTPTALELSELPAPSATHLASSTSSLPEAQK